MTPQVHGHNMNTLDDRQTEDLRKLEIQLEIKTQIYIVNIESLWWHWRVSISQLAICDKQLMIATYSGIFCMGHDIDNFLLTYPIYLCFGVKTFTT